MHSRQKWSANVPGYGWYPISAELNLLIDRERRLRNPISALVHKWSSLFQITITDEVVRINLPKEIILDVEVDLAEEELPITFEGITVAYNDQRARIFFSTALPTDKLLLTIEHVVPSFGKIKGLEFPGGIRQFCSIPYSDISKHWTRSTSICPQSPEYPDLIGGLVLVKPFPHFQMPELDKLNCLNLNIVMPPEYWSGPHHVMVWIHGGASTHPAYDMTKFVSHAVNSGTQVVGAIEDDLAPDGYRGAGNFGLTDQQTALEWVQQYISDFNSDPTKVTIFGESAGDMGCTANCLSPCCQPVRKPEHYSNVVFERHEGRWKALLQHLSIDLSAANALDQLRSVAQKALANATCLIEGTMGTTGNPCDDGWFHSKIPSISSISSPPAWL
ncbi:hypothetical protein GGP41_009669 [Bipolaris sorokiniana]|uniref:Carboxylesterase type B domain-containing protein n=1 Tax=Cochliobolus sativus TaxID=45130 RepID=A0A8H6DUN7_COCSA|nr:hypothetical protein GGP41_009669 [Bipolaris sorokiniana]